MSKLVDLFQAGKYARLDKLSGHSPNTANAQDFSVRKQSDTQTEVRQKNADNFLDDTFQKGFKVDKPSMSTSGFQKAEGTDSSDFTGETNGAPGNSVNTAFDTYTRTTSGVTSRTNYNSKLVHRYLATDVNKQYVTQNSAAGGVVLGYTPA